MIALSLPLPLAPLYTDRGCQVECMYRLFGSRVLLLEQFLHCHSFSPVFSFSSAIRNGQIIKDRFVCSQVRQCLVGNSSSRANPNASLRSSLVTAQNYEEWRRLCSSSENKTYCQQWIDWVRGGQISQSPSSGNRPKPSKPSQPKPTPTPTPSWPAETAPDYPKNLPPPTATPQQGSTPPPFAQAVCIVEIYSYITRAEGQSTRTRTRTVIAPFVSTITQLITTVTTSILVETVVQEQKEQTVTSSQTICI